MSCRNCASRSAHAGKADVTQVARMLFKNGVYPRMADAKLDAQIKKEIEKHLREGFVVNPTMQNPAMPNAVYGGAASSSVAPAEPLVTDLDDDEDEEGEEEDEEEGEEGDQEEEDEDEEDEADEGK